MSGKSQLRVQQGKAGVRWTRGCRLLLGDTSLTFLPQQGASGFFADHFGDGMEADGVF